MTRLLTAVLYSQELLLLGGALYHFHQCHHYQPASRVQGSDDTAAYSRVVQSRIIVAHFTTSIMTTAGEFIVDQDALAHDVK